METRIMRTSLLAAVVVAPSFALAQAPPTPGGASGPTGIHDCVVIVFDDSGSMDEDFGGQRRMEAAKRGLKVVLRSVPRDTWVGLFALNAGWQYDLGPLDQARLDAVIDRMETNGGTPLARSIKAGADRLMAEREKQFGYGSYRLLVVTDGQETENNEAIETYPPEVRARGLTLDVIGVGIGQEHSLRRQSHTYRSADNPRELERAIREVLAERVDQSDQTGGGDAFALVAGLDPGVAQQAIVALGKMPNHPIGEQPPVASTGGGGPPSGSASSGGSGYTPRPPDACGCRIAASPQLPAASILLLGLIALARRRRR
jgi:hypothetical protein